MSTTADGSLLNAPGANAAPGEYREHIGPAAFYDIQTAIQFNLLTALGLREHHTLLDIGCGSLRAGRVLMPYLRPGHYYGIEPLPWLIREGIANELGEDLVRLKRPTFDHNDQFTLTAFGRTFDFMIAQSIFSHCSQAQIRRCVAQARQALAPDGLFAATFFEGPVNYDGDKWVAKADYTIEHMRSMVEAEGMACTLIDWPHPDPQQWIVIHHPGTPVPLAQMADAQRLKMLEDRLAETQKQFNAIRSHPYVRFGLGVKFFLVWLGYERRRLFRLLRGDRS